MGIYNGSGTVREDGSVDYSVTGTGTAAIMMSQTKDEEIPEFINGGFLQIPGSIWPQMEALMGAANGILLQI